MVESSRLEEEKTIEDNIIKDARNLFRLKKTKQEKNDSVIKDIKNLFTSKAENSEMKMQYSETLGIFLRIKKKKIIMLY